MSPEEAKFRSQDAKQLLENKLFKEAFSAVESHLDDVALSCDPDNKDKAQRIIISRQLLAAVKREIERVVEDGLIAEVRIAELEKRNKLLRFIR